VNLCGIVGRAADVVLREAATFKEGHLREVVSNVHAHEVATKGTSITLLAFSAGDEICLGVHMFA
jgi:hypothetical protein